MAGKDKKRSLVVRIVCAVLAFLMAASTILYVIFALIQGV